MWKIKRDIILIEKDILLDIIVFNEMIFRFENIRW